MNVVGALFLFVLFIFAYLIIVEIFVMLFRITGLTDEKARFQVISMLTNSGYTTKEAELVVNSRRRRKLARFVMVFGYAFTVTIVSTLVNLFIQFRKTFTGSILAFIPIAILIIMITILLKKNVYTNNTVDRIIRKIAHRILKNENSNTIMIVDQYGDLVIAMIELKILPKELDGIELSKSNIKSEHGLNVLLKHSSEGEFLPMANTIFETGDTIVVMGSEKKIRRIFGIAKALS